MAKRFTDTEKYKKPFLRALQGPYKLLWDYLYHDCNHAGIWIVDFEIAQIYLGQDMPVNEKDALKFFNKGEKRIEVFDGGKKWFIRPFIEFQYGVLNPDNRVHKSILTELRRVGIKPLARALQGPSVGAKDTDIDKDKDKDKKKGDSKGGKFSLEQVLMAAEKSGLPKPEAERFFNFYESKGWLVGKTKMKSLPHAVANWRCRWESERKNVNGSQKKEPSTWEIQQKIKIIENEMKSLRKKHQYETASGYAWNSEIGRKRHKTLREELKTLQKAILAA